MLKRMPMKNTRRDALAMLALLLIWLLFSWRFMSPDAANRVSLPAGDFTETFFVFRSFALHELSAGHPPLWMPCIYAGYPFQADPQSALFYPPALLNLGFHLLLGWDRFRLVALTIESLAHLLIASVLTYLFLRQELRRRAAALLGAVVFAYGGYLTSYPLLQLSVVESAVWLPLALMGARGLAGEARPRHYIMATLGLALPLLAGHPQTLMHIGFTWLAYLIYRAWRVRLSWRVVVGRLVPVGVATAGLCAVQLLPTLQYWALSTRSSLSLDKAATGFPLRDVIQLVLPGLVSLWQPLYVGILPLALALWFALIRLHPTARSDRAFWIGLALVALLFSFGNNLFAYEAAYLAVPGYGLFRQQERHAFLFSFALAMLSAYGCDVLLSPLARAARRALRRALSLVLAALPVVLVSLVLLAMLGELKLVDLSQSSLEARLAGLLLMVTGVAALFGARLARPRAWRAVATALIALAIIDLFTVNRPINQAEVENPFPPQPALAAALEDETPFFRLQDDWRLPGHTACMNGLEDVWGVTPIKPKLISSFQKKVPEVLRWQLLGVRYVVTWRGGLERDDGTPIPAEQVFAQGEAPDVTYTYRLEGTPRYAWVVHDLRVVDTTEQLYEVLNEPGFDGYASAAMLAPAPAVAASGGGVDAVEVLQRAASHIVVRAQLAEAGLLVFSQGSYPGWVARVDGVQVPLYQVDGLLPAVALEAGEHTVELFYRPVAFAVGAALSGGTIVLAVLALIWVHRRSCRASQPRRGLGGISPTV